MFYLYLSGFLWPYPYEIAVCQSHASVTIAINNVHPWGWVEQDRQSKEEEEFYNMRKRIILAISALFTIVISNHAQTTREGLWTEYASNTEGTHIVTSSDGSTITILTAEGLAWMAKNSNSTASSSNLYEWGEGMTFILGNDIDLSAHYWTPICFFDTRNKMYSVSFGGTLTGKDASGTSHSITGMYIDTSLFTEQPSYANYNVGLIGEVADNGIIEHLTVSGAIVAENYSRIGGIAGGFSGTMRNCSFTGSVTGGVYDDPRDGDQGQIGGVVGGIYRNGAVSYCQFQGSVVGSCEVGGIVGKMYAAMNCSNSLTNCYVTAGSSIRASGTNEYGDYCGGAIVGDAQNWGGTCTLAGNTYDPNVTVTVNGTAYSGADGNIGVGGYTKPSDDSGSYKIPASSVAVNGISYTLQDGLFYLGTGSGDNNSGCTAEEVTIPTVIPAGTGDGQSGTTVAVSVTGINSKAFSGSSLRSITLSQNITDIATDAFEGCNSLSEIHFGCWAPAAVTNLVASFSAIPANCTLYVPATKVSEYEALFANASNITVSADNIGWTAFGASAKAGTDYYTSGNSISVYTALGLAWAAQQVNSTQGWSKRKTITLYRDIDLSDYEWDPIGASQDTCPFEGTFNGNNKTITGLNENVTNGFAGLFGYISEGTVKNLTVSGANIQCSGNSSGIIVGEAKNATIDKCTITNTTITTSAEGTGGIIGTADEQTSVTNCTVTACQIEGMSGAGGIVGNACYGPKAITGNTVSGSTTIKAGKGVGAIAGATYETAMFEENYYTSEVKIIVTDVSDDPVSGPNIGTSSGDLAAKNGAVAQGYTYLTFSFADECQWATYYSTTDLACPTGLQPYVVTGFTDDKVAVAPIDYIPANTAVLLKKVNDNYQTIIPPADDKPETNLDQIDAGLFLGVTSATAVTDLAGDGDKYILYHDQFMPTLSGTLPSGHCYLVLPIGASARQLTISIGSATASHNTQSKETMEQPWYNLQGRRVCQPAKGGVYIVGDKKVIIR